MPRLSDFEALTFDCYGTLIDWETGILQALEPWLERQYTVSPPPGGRSISPPPEGRSRRPPDEMLETFAGHESALEAEHPGMPYPRILARVHRRLAADWGLESSAEDAVTFGASVPHWPAFADSVEALRELQRYYHLVILSNVDRASFAGSARRLGVDFHAVLTAEDIGSYKPDPHNFKTLLRVLARRGTSRDKILHTAQSLYHDHQPARRLGLATAWIDRRHDRQGWGATLPPGEEVPVDFRFASLAEMAAARRAEGD